MSNPRIELLGLLALAAVLFLMNTGGYDLWPADEPRFGEVPREMLQSGNYLVPYCNGEPYKEKPPLLFWLIVLVSLPFGDVTEFSARAPSALAAIAAVFFTYRLAARFYDRRTARWSALVLMTMSLFWWEARSVRTDMLLTACMTGALWAFWRWHEERRVAWLAAFYAAVTLGLYAKGPPALIFPALLVAFFYWRRKADRRQLHWVIGLAAALALVLAWFIPARLSLPATPVHPAIGESNAIYQELYRQIIGRLVLGVSKAQPPWYYLWNVPIGMLPWTLFLPWFLPWIWKRRHEDDRMRALLAWTVPAFLFFSISVGKRNVYLLPIYPALAILMARSVLDLVDGDHVLWRTRTTYLWSALLLLLGVAPFGLLLTEYRGAVDGRIVVFSLCALGFAIGNLPAMADARTVHIKIASNFALLALLATVLVFPALNAYKGAGDFCRPVRELALAKQEMRLYSIAFSREEYVFYSRHFHQDRFIDPLPVNAIPEVDEMTSAKRQRKIRNAITKAVDGVEVSSLSAPTDADLTALRDAVEKAIAEPTVDPGFASGFKQALTEAVHQFAAEFTQPGPAFAYVQEQDWKWLLPLLPQRERFVVIAQEGVGKRTMLLVANETAMKQVQASSHPPLG